MIWEGDGAGIEGVGGGRTGRGELIISVQVCDGAEKGRQRRAIFDMVSKTAREICLPDHCPLAAKSMREFRSERCELLVHGS